jgi:hypothetical protein
MAWGLRKNGKQYYYRSRRVNGRNTKDYFGCGPRAIAVAARVEQACRQRAAVAEASRTALAEMKRISRPLRTFSERCDQLLAAVLLAAGYHSHKGEWRSRRVPRNVHGSRPEVRDERSRP